MATELTLTAFAAASGESDVDIAVSLEASVFFEWFGNTRELLAQEYDYLAGQTLFVLGRRKGNPVAFMRIGVPGPIRQRSLSDMEREPFGLDVAGLLDQLGISADSILDLMTIGVVPSARGRQLARPLFGALADLADRFHCDHFAAVVDTNVMRYLSRIGLELEPASGAVAKQYLGSLGIPVLSSIGTIWDWLGVDRVVLRQNTSLDLLDAETRQR